MGLSPFPLKDFPVSSKGVKTHRGKGFAFCLLIRQLKLTANEPVTRPVLSPDTVLSPPPFRSAIQHLPRWGEAPERSLVNVLDHSLPVGHSNVPYPKGYSNATMVSAL